MLRALLILTSAWTGDLRTSISCALIDCTQLLDSAGNAKLSDFGIRREIRTIAWIELKVLRGERYSEKAGVYSVGVLLVKAATYTHGGTKRWWCLWTGE
jgi:hypothetical protein